MRIIIISSWKIRRIIRAKTHNKKKQRNKLRNKKNSKKKPKKKNQKDNHNKKKSRDKKSRIIGMRIIRTKWIIIRRRIRAKRMLITKGNKNNHKK